jgi:hypothetical protein
VEQIENRVAIEQENDAEEVMNSTASSDAREALEHGPHRSASQWVFARLQVRKLGEIQNGNVFG